MYRHVYPTWPHNTTYGTLVCINHILPSTSTSLSKRPSTLHGSNGDRSSIPTPSLPIQSTRWVQTLWILLCLTVPGSSPYPSRPTKLHGMPCPLFLLPCVSFCVGDGRNRTVDVWKMKKIITWGDPLPFSLISGLLIDRLYSKTKQVRQDGTRNCTDAQRRVDDDHLIMTGSKMSISIPYCVSS